MAPCSPSTSPEERLAKRDGSLSKRSRRAVRKLLLCLILFVFTSAHAAARRVVIVKVDGLPPQMLADFVEARDPVTGLSRLPWIEKVFFRDGVWVKNFYSRGVSVSAPSWQVLETGWPLVIHGNVEYDRY